MFFIIDIDYLLMLISLILVYAIDTINSTLQPDPNGYIVYCPCMGRFGNQADHFLGSFSFARHLNRTLVLPPWVEYVSGRPNSMQTPFDHYFDVNPLSDYHRVIVMEEFMEKLAPDIWPPGQRISFCYMARGNTNHCDAKNGNPFGPFWDNFNIDFDKSEFYDPLHYETYDEKISKAWKERFPSKLYPVLAFVGAPANFPVNKENRKLHKYLKWNSDMNNKGDDFIHKTFGNNPFLGIHLRNGIDWTRACEHIQHHSSLFASPQCLGYNNEYGKATAELCFPSKATVIQTVREKVKDIQAKGVFVASDFDYMINDLNNALKNVKVKVHRLTSPDPHLDLVILAKATHYIGNCISSFSAFAKRERDAKNLPSTFWAFPVQNNDRHIEL